MERDTRRVFRLTIHNMKFHTVHVVVMYIVLHSGIAPYDALIRVTQVTQGVATGQKKS